MERHTFPLIPGGSFEGEGEILGELNWNNSTIHIKEYNSDPKSGIFIFKMLMNIHWYWPLDWRGPDLRSVLYSLTCIVELFVGLELFPYQELQNSHHKMTGSFV